MRQPPLDPQESARIDALNDRVKSLADQSIDLALIVKDLAQEVRNMSRQIARMDAAQNSLRDMLNRIPNGSNE